MERIEVCCPQSGGEEHFSDCLICGAAACLGYTCKACRDRRTSLLQANVQSGDRGGKPVFARDRRRGYAAL